jgi:hypothetical protein
MISFILTNTQFWNKYTIILARIKRNCMDKLVRMLEHWKNGVKRQNSVPGISNITLTLDKPQTTSSGESSSDSRAESTDESEDDQVEFVDEVCSTSSEAESGSDDEFTSNFNYFFQNLLLFIVILKVWREV